MTDYDHILLLALSEMLHSKSLARSFIGAIRPMAFDAILTVLKMPSLRAVALLADV